MNIRNFFWNVISAPARIKRMEYLMGAMADPNGFGFFNLMLENANVPEKYRYMFCPPEDGAVFVDCGMNVGLITDIARYMNMEVYGFEPNPVAINLLNKKYATDNLVHIYPNAVSNHDDEMRLYVNPYGLYDQGASIIEEFAHNRGRFLDNKITVKVKKLTDIINNDILSKHEKIHLLKLDIEGAEFGVIDDIIDEKLYAKINYIVVETHESLFKNGKIMMSEIRKKIKEHDIDNIYLDWI